MFHDFPSEMKSLPFVIYVLFTYGTRRSNPVTDSGNSIWQSDEREGEVVLVAATVDGIGGTSRRLGGCVE